jgi:hypothetical protein
VPWASKKVRTRTTLGWSSWARVRASRELPQAVAEGLGVLGGVGQHGGAVAVAGGGLPGQVLLDGHPGLQVGVPGQVGDAEPARLAQHPPQQVLAVQQGAVGQRQRTARRRLVVAAVRAHRRLALGGEAAGAQVRPGGLGVPVGVAGVHGGIGAIRCRSRPPTAGRYARARCRPWGAVRDASLWRRRWRPAQVARALHERGVQRNVGERRG